MNFQEDIKKIKRLASISEEAQGLVKQITGKELVSYEGIDALVAALMGFYNAELKKKSNNGHTHTKANITDFPTSLKNPSSLTVQANGTSLGSYDGSSTQTFNVTANGVGAYTKGEVDSKLGGKAPASHTHIATQVTQDGTHRFVTDAEKTAWNNKLDKSGVVNNLTTNDSTKALSAAMGKQLNDMKQKIFPRDFIAGKEKAITTQQFIETLKSLGAFSQMHWASRGGWWFAGTDYITDTPFGAIKLSGAVVEVFSTAEPFFTIRITTPPENPRGGHNNEFIYCENGEGYIKEWRKAWNSKNFNPDAKLNTSGGTISGALTVTGNVVTNGTTTVGGLLTANDVYLTSDRRAKTNLKIIDNPLEKIKKINGYTFDWIKTKEKSSGVIAQEVEEILPSIVYDKGDGKKVNYNGIIALLVEANKKLLKRLEVLESKVR